MRIFEAVVIRINEIPAENGAFSQKEIVVSPYSTDREIASEFIAIPPGTFPTDAFGSGVTTLPELNQRCIVCETAGYRRVQILSYTPFATTTSYGEYTPVDVSSGGAAFKIGGTKPITMYFHKGGKWELYSNEFCRLSLDGTKKALAWTVDTEARIFAGGRIFNTLEEIDGVANSTQHLEVYTQALEWKQNSDIRIAGEKSVLNPESTIVPLPDYTYIPKVIIKAGTVVNNFDSELGKIQGHVYQVETRQSIYSGDKDTVSTLKLGRQSEMYKWDSDRVYPAGDILEWTSKVARITSEASHITTQLFRYGELEKDVISNGAPVEYVKGEVFRTQSHINIIEPLGAPLIDGLAEGKGYKFKWNYTGAEQQYLVSYGRLISPELIGNEDFLYKSAVREHFHAYDDHSFGKIATPTGMKYDSVKFFQDSGVNGLYFKKFSKITEGNEEIFQKELLTNEKLEFEFVAPERSAYRVLDAQKYTNFVHITENRALETHFEPNLYKNYVKLDGTTEKTEEFDSTQHKTTVKIGSQTFLIEFKEDSIIISLDGPGPIEDSILIGGNDFAHKLVTKEWVQTVFDLHMHPSASPGPPTPPITMPLISAPAQPSHLTYITKVE